jgi:hypothetical protein
MGHFFLWELKLLNAFLVSLCEQGFIYQLHISYPNSSVLRHVQWRHWQTSVVGIPANLHICVVWVTLSQAKQQNLSITLFCIPLQFFYCWFDFNLRFSNAITNGWIQMFWKWLLHTTHRLEDRSWNVKQKNLLKITSIFLNINSLTGVVPIIKKHLFPSRVGQNEVQYIERGSLPLNLKIFILSLMSSFWIPISLVMMLYVAFSEIVCFVGDEITTALAWYCLQQYYQDLGQVWPAVRTLKLGAFLSSLQIIIWKLSCPKCPRLIKAKYSPDCHHEFFGIPSLQLLHPRSSFKVMYEGCTDFQVLELDLWHLLSHLKT